MSECYTGIFPSYDDLFSDLCYSNVLGIVNSPGFSCHDHVEDNHVLIYVTKGFFVCEQGTFSRVLTSGEYLLLDKKSPHSYYFAERSSTEIYWMHINGALANRFIGQICELSPLPMVGRNAKVFSLLKQAISSFREKRADPFSHSETILNLLNTLLKDAYRQNQKINRSSEELAFREKFDGIIENVPLGQISLDVICEKMHLSKYYFSHLFKRYYGVSPMNYILRLKLSQSQQFLQYSDLKISTIAKECGFSSPSHFSVAFRREYGVTPENYRNQSK